MLYFASALFSVLLLAGACRSPARTPARPSTPVVPGCYRLVQGPWSAGSGGHPWSHAMLRSFQPPATFALDTAPVGPSRTGAPVVDPWRVARVLDTTSRWFRDASRLAGWGRDQTDTLTVIWTTGFSGTTLRLVPTGRDTLVGYVEPRTDERFTGERLPRAAVTAVRMACP